MGNFYTNFAVRGSAPTQVLAVLREGKRRALVTPEVDGITIVYDEACDTLDDSEIYEVGSLLSRELKCPVLASMVYHDDVLWLGLYEAGELSAAYASIGPTLDITRISRTFGSVYAIPLIWVVMNLPHVGLETIRHKAFARLVGIPQWCVGTGYRYVVEQGELPTGLTMEMMESTHDLQTQEEDANQSDNPNQAMLQRFTQLPVSTFRDRCRMFVNLLWFPGLFLLAGFSLPYRYTWLPLSFRIGVIAMNFAVLISVTIVVRDEYGVPGALVAYCLTNAALGEGWIIFLMIRGMLPRQDGDRRD